MRDVNGNVPDRPGKAEIVLLFDCTCLRAMPACRPGIVAGLMIITLGINVSQASALVKRITVWTKWHRGS
jgi:hypothetical protein